MDLAASSKVLLSVFETACGPRRRVPTEGNLPAPGDSETNAANRMESFWIKVLHDAFRSYYDAHSQPWVAVLSKAHLDAEWNRNEFLHDVTVLKREEVLSAYKNWPLPVARRVLWQVESELSGNGRDVAIDFSKLVAGSAKNKVLIVRQPVEHQSEGHQKVRRFVADMAPSCSGNLFLAFLPSYASKHPHLKYWSLPESLPLDLFVRDCAKPANWEDWSHLLKAFFS